MGIKIFLRAYVKKLIVTFFTNICGYNYSCIEKQRKDRFNMLCEKCKKKKATVFYNETVNSRSRSLSLCSDCASALKKNGDLEEITVTSGGFGMTIPFYEDAPQDSRLIEFLGKPEKIPTDIEKFCSVCGSTRNSMARDGRVGCAACYKYFSDELSQSLDMLRSPSVAYVGSTPKKHKAKKTREEKIKALRNEMQEAIGDECFEKAASLRDEIRNLETEV